MSTIPEKLNKIKCSTSYYKLFNSYTHIHMAQFIVLPQIIRNVKTERMEVSLSLTDFCTNLKLQEQNQNDNFR